MKKTILNRNYSLLVLVLLILYITYINIPNNFNMTGGAGVNPYDKFPEVKLNNILMKHSSLYTILYKYWWVYIAVNIVLILLLANYGYQQYLFQGLPFAGVQTTLPWDAEGQVFLTNFYSLARTKYGLWTPSNAPPAPNAEIEEFEKNADSLVNDAKSAVNTFCNLVSPCNVCACQGPDPNYSGPSATQPFVYYKGPNSVTGNSCDVPLLSPSGTPSAASGLMEMNAARGITNKFVGRLPQCCCNLLQKYGKDSSNKLTKASIDAMIAKPPNPVNNGTHSDGLGLLGAGCDTHSPLPTLPTKNSDGTAGTGKPHRDVNTGNSTYITDMISSCTSKESKGADGTPTYDYYLRICQNYDPNLDLGVSMYHATKVNRDGFSNYIPPERFTTSQTPSAANLLDIGADDVKWTLGPNPNFQPTLKIERPSDWPPSAEANALFNTGKVETSYWYKSSTNITYILTIDSHLYEIYGYPVVDRTKVKRAVDEITSSSSPVGYAYLDKYLARPTSVGANKYGAIINGEYVFP